MDKIIIKKVEISTNDITIDYDVTGKLKEFFNLENKFHVHYYDNVSSVPPEIAVIPFISNVLPIIWLTDSELIIESLEEKYANSIDKTRMAFNKMYHTDIFKGKVTIKNKKKIKTPSNEKNVSVFYSGGVDSTSSLVSCFERKEKPLLITIWGTDVWDYNVDGFESLKNNAEYVGNKYNLENLYIKTNFRKFIYEHILTKKLLDGRINDSWWRGIQHGIGLIGHVAPYAYTRGIKMHYIPATLNNKNFDSTCGSFPIIDESVKFLDCSISHDGYEYDRLDKVEHIVNYFEKNGDTFPLRVCFMDKGKKLNCCQCEKCYLTIMELMSLNKNPNDWGFKITNNDIKNKIPNYLYEKASDSSINVEIWNRIKQEFLKNKTAFSKRSEVKWIFDYIPEQAYELKTPKISVVVPCYNVSKYVSKCLDSILNQTYKNLEIILVEDCSTDNTLEILKEYEKKDKRIKLIKNKKNGGLSHARNVGIKESTGKYIGFVDSDDYIDLDFYEKLISSIINEKSEVAVADIKVVYEETNVVTLSRCYEGNEFNLLNVVNNGLAASACNKLFKKDLLNKYEFAEGKVNEDIAVVIPTLVNASNISYVDKSYYYYIQRGGSIQNSGFSDKRFDIFYGVDTTLERIKNSKDYDALKDAIVFNQLIVLLIYVIPKIKDKKRRKEVLKKYNELSLKYNILNNRYYLDFLKKCGKKHRMYYKTLFKLNHNKHYTLTNMLISLYDVIYKSLKRNKIGTGIDLDKVVEKAKYQKSLEDEKIKVSVVVPNYNYSNFLYQRIYSILSQDYKISELIILDDKSKDNSVLVIDEIVDKIKDYVDVKTIYNKENSGSAFKQWQKGFEKASGDYVWIAEADDYCDSKMLSELVKPLDNNNVVISYCDTAFVDVFGTVTLKSVKPEIDIQHSKHWNTSYVTKGIDEINNYSYLNNTIANVSSCIIKKDDYKEYFKKAGEYKQAGDWLFYVSLMSLGDIAYSNKTYNYYRIHGANVSSVTEHKKHLDELNKIYDYYIKEFKLNKIQKNKIEERLNYLKNLWEVHDEEE